jgi:hypothetical protein
MDETKLRHYTHSKSQVSENLNILYLCFFKFLLRILEKHICKN